MEIFATHAHKYYELGWSIMPVEGKKPLFTGWEQYSINRASETLVDGWTKVHPKKNVTVVCGKSSGIIGFDLDSDDEGLLEFILNHFPKSPLKKRGRRGFTAFYKYNGIENSHCSHERYQILSNGTHAVLPPSVHPLTGESYFWIDEDYGEDLPEINDDLIKKLDEYILKHPHLHKKKNDTGEWKNDGGRHKKLVSMGFAALGKGKSDEEVFEELSDYDEKFHDPPYFSDKTHHGGKPRELVIKNMIKSLKKGAEKKEKERLMKLSKEKILDKIIIQPEKPIGKFPMEVFPSEIRDFLLSVSENMCADVEYVIVPFLVAVSTLIGRDVNIQVTKTWREKCVLWGLNVGEPSKNKSSPMKYIRKIMLEEYENELVQKFLLDYQVYKQQDDIIGMMNKTIKDTATKEFKDHKDKNKLMDDLRKREIQPAKPIKPEVTISVPTSEAFVSCSDVSPNLTVWVDEISRVFIAMEEDKKLRDLFLEASTGQGRENSTRKTVVSNVANSLSCNMMGTIQPEKIKEYFSQKSNDGFEQRFSLIAFGEKKIDFHLNNNDHLNEDVIKRLVRKITAPNSLMTPSIREGTFSFHHEAEDELNRLYKKYRTMSLDAKLNAKYREFLGKLPIVIVRLSFVIEALHWAISPYAMGKDNATFIRKSSVLCAMAVVEDFLMPNFERFVGVNSDSFESKIKILEKDIMRLEIKEFTIAKLLKDTHIKGLTRHDHMSLAVQSLVESGFCHPIDKRVRGGGIAYETY